MSSPTFTKYSKIPRQSILGEYKIRIFKDEEDPKWYLAEINSPGGNNFMTQGRTEEDIWQMIGDAILTCFEIRLSWWNRFLYKLMIFK